MENKYFTPDIEDIHAGYECELLIFDKWEPNIVKSYTELRSVDECIKDKVIRVPYLTKEQIEVEGWEEMNAPIMSIGHGFLYIPFLKNNCRLDYNYTTNILNIKKDDVTNLYYGECKDINTFRLIQKLLGIK